MYLSFLVIKINLEGLPYQMDHEDLQIFLKGTIESATVAFQRCKFFFWRAFPFLFL